jgi:hypothetical protein
MKPYLPAVIVGLALIAPPAVAQNTPPAGTSSNAAANSKWQTSLQPGQWRASKLKGLNVYNSNNEKIGDIDDLIVDQTGKVAAVVIGVGGFLGLGEHDVAVPISELKWDAKGAGTTGTGTANRTSGNDNRGYPDHAVLNMTKDQLKAAPEFKYANK